MMRNVLLGIAIIACGCCVSALGSAEPRCVALPQALTKTLASHGWGSPGSYVAALRSLNGGASPQAVVLLTGPAWCGSGGCTLLVLQHDTQAWVLVSKTTIVRPPIRVLPQRHNGWHSLSVFVAGGITPGYTAILPFGKSGYPGNPTVAPAFRAHHANSGELLINSLHCSAQADAVAPNISFQRTPTRYAGRRR